MAKKKKCEIEGTGVTQNGVRSYLPGPHISSIHSLHFNRHGHLSPHFVRRQIQPKTFCVVKQMTKSEKHDDTGCCCTLVLETVAVLLLLRRISFLSKRMAVSPSLYLSLDVRLPSVPLSFSAGIFSHTNKKKKEEKEPPSPHTK